MAAALPAQSIVYLRLASVVVLTVGLAIWWVSRYKRFDKAWFDCRAIAESVKTTSWRYMVRYPPFHDDQSSEKEFVARLRKIRKERGMALQYSAEYEDNDAGEVTARMRNIRSLDLTARKKLYLDARLANQRQWYLGKAKENAAASKTWFWTVTFLQITAIVAAVGEAVLSTIPVSVVPLITTLAAVFVAWSQIKRHDELAQTYALAGHELRELETLATSIQTEDDLHALVEDTEETVSREHTLWCARRNAR